MTLLLPAVCPVCGRSLRWGETALCDGCLAVAAASTPSPRFDLPGIKRLDSCCSWNSESSNLVRAFKYRYRPRLVEQLLPLVELALAESALPEVDLILPVPLHSARRRERGYNQAELLALLLCQLLGAPLHTGNLIRCRYTPSQTRLQRDQRKLNVANAFRVLDPASLEGRTLLLVDDVVTTGATLIEIAALLPPGETFAWTLVSRVSACDDNDPLE
ncbi:MAG: ComF family protein [Candidatus Delongbacteria bacterium]|nr:ComF family protein [Candidatus Delongbacteria bacterium]